MYLKDLVVVTGFPGIQKMVNSRTSGMMIEDLDTGVVRFAPVRKHQFSPLETISIYIDGEEETADLRTVLQSMLDKAETLPPISHDAPSPELRAYFSEIMPNHDREKVHISDIKKIIRWYRFLEQRGYLTLEEPVDEEE